MKSKNTTTNDVERQAWFRRRVAELAELIRRLPADRRAAFDEWIESEESGREPKNNKGDL